VANDTDRPRTQVFEPRPPIAHTLHPFATGCMWKMFAPRRQVQPGVIQPLE
jgi:hypothetical protein